MLPNPENSASCPPETVPPANSPPQTFPPANSHPETFPTANSHPQPPTNHMTTRSQNNITKPNPKYIFLPPLATNSEPTCAT